MTVCSTRALLHTEWTDGCNGVTKEDCKKKANEFRLTGGDVGGGLRVKALEDQMDPQTSVDKIIRILMGSLKGRGWK